MATAPSNKLPIFISLFFAVFLAFVFVKLLPLAERQPVFLLALPLSCVLFLGVVMKPKWIVVLLIFSRVLMDPLLNATKSDSSMGFGAVLNLLVILVTLFLGLRDHSAPWLKSGFIRSWIIFLCACLLAVAYSPVASMGIKMFFNMLSYLCMAALPSLIDPKKNDKKFWIKVLLVSSFAAAMFANADMARGGVFFQDAGNRILGTFTHPNILGFYLVWLLMLVFYVFKSGLFRLSRFKKFFLFMYLLNIFALLVATKTRNAWLCAWLLFFLYGVLKERRYIFYSIGILIGIVGAVYFIPELASRMSDLVEHNSGQVNSFAWRLEVWKNSLEAVMERWLFGHGLASFRALSGNFLMANREGAEAHNVYVQILFEMGVVGLVAYLSIYRSLFREFYSRYKISVSGLSKEYAIVMAYLAIYLFSGFGDNMLYYLTLNWYCWFFLGVILKATRFQRLVYAKK